MVIFSLQVLYTTNPHERWRAMAEHVVSRAPAEQNRSVAARQALGGRSPSARQTTCSAIARRALVGITGVLKQRISHKEESNIWANFKI